MTDPKQRPTAESDEPDERDDGAPPQWTTREERISAVEAAIQVAIRRGEFDDLPGSGKPLEGLAASDDPDWWIRRKIERENLTGLAPPAIQLRNEHRAMDETLDALRLEHDVRKHLEDFNARVRRARMQLEGGPPVVTPLHDIDEDVRAWRERRSARTSVALVTSDASRGTWLSRWIRGTR